MHCQIETWFDAAVESPWGGNVLTNQLVVAVNEIWSTLIVYWWLNWMCALLPARGAVLRCANPQQALSYLPVCLSLKCLTLSHQAPSCKNRGRKANPQSSVSPSQSEWKQKNKKKKQETPGKTRLIIIEKLRVCGCRKRIIAYSLETRLFLWAQQWPRRALCCFSKISLLYSPKTWEERRVCRFAAMSII